MAFLHYAAATSASAIFVVTPLNRTCTPIEWRLTMKNKGKCTAESRNFLFMQGCYTIQKMAFSAETDYIADR